LAEPCRPVAFRASDGYEFLGRRYPTPGRPLVRMVVLHGIRSHGGWYARSCEAFAAAGCEVHFLDRRGAGMNTARRGDAPGFRRLLDDVAEYITAERRTRPWLPTVLVGVSWGGKLAVGLQYRRPGLVHGLVLIAPGLKPLVRPSPGERLRILAARAMRPGKAFPIPLNDPELFTPHADARRFIAADRFGLRHATARFLFASVGLDVYLRRAARRVTVPTLLLLAGTDRVIDNARTRKVVGRFPSRDCKVIDYPGAGHTLEFEPAGHPWVRDVTRWALATAGRSSAPTSTWTSRPSPSATG
jgi:alpha-beta hydrolase superfamily lysophospholipase